MTIARHASLRMVLPGSDEAALVAEKWHLKPLLVTPIVESLPFGNCYWNAAYVAGDRGGSVALGWKIEVVADLFITAVHHAVWRNPDGDLQCVTKPGSGSVGEGSISFVADTRQKWDGRWPPFIPDKFMGVSSEVDTRQLEKAHRLRIAATKRMAQAIRRAGGRYDPSQGLVCSARVPNLEELQSALRSAADLERSEASRVLRTL